MRPEDKSAADNQMGMRSMGSTGSDTGDTAGVKMTAEDQSGLPKDVTTGPKPDEKAYTNTPNSNAVPINKSRGTGVQINNGAMDGGQASGGDGNASAYAKVTSIQGEKVEGMNYGPSIGRVDNPPAVITRTGTPESVEDALSAIEDRWPGTDTEHLRGQQLNGTPSGKDRLWR